MSLKDLLDLASKAISRGTLKYYGLEYVLFLFILIGGQNSVLFADRSDAVLSSADSQKGSVINVLDFGAVPNDGQNDLEALRLALKACKDFDARILVLPPGRYVLADEMAQHLRDDVLHRRYGNNPQNYMFNRDLDYVVGLDFTGIKNLTINGYGAELYCDGWMETIVLANAQNIVMNGITVDNKRPANSVGEIIQVGEDFVDVKFFDWCPVFDGINFCRFMVYDDDLGRIAGGCISCNDWKIVAPQTMRMKSQSDLLEKGRKLLCWHCFHFRPAILIYNSLNITLSDVSIYAHPGMGIVGHLSENIELNHLRIIPRSGRYISTNTDATHFASCYGFLRFNECEFGGQGDDATNVHNYYKQIASEPVNNTCMIDTLRSYDLHSMRMDYPRDGDVFAVVKRKTLEEVGYIQVESVDIDFDKWKTTITYKGNIPFDYKDYYLADISALPMLTFRNCKVDSHRARSVLCKTRNVIIEGNVFNGCTGTAIHIGAEGHWMEGATSKNVIVRNNQFNNCGFADGTINGASAVSIHVAAEDVTVPGLHKNIIIENNDINGGYYGISVSSAENVLISNNNFRNIRKDNVKVDYSNMVKIYENTISQ